MKRLPPPVLTGAYLVPDTVGDRSAYPFSLPCVQGLDLTFDSAVTIFVGENGCGKSTVLQALATLLRLPPGGGGRAELGHDHGVPTDLSAELANALRPRLRKHPRSAWYFRADMNAHFAAALVARGGHHAFRDDDGALFADRDLHTLSHGEAFLATVNNRARRGMLFFDEPSPRSRPSGSSRSWPCSPGPFDGVTPRSSSRRTRRSS
ncbi:MAG: AAA family ATPase [Proteobacteria bacterium]|nr:AAA family ATPase [Pseudomonadota bacterium]MCP4915375.1 AAA family ATPase [Pseudomonadota bacterium]